MTRKAMLNFVCRIFMRIPRSIYQICYLLNNHGHIVKQNNQENCSDSQAHLPKGVSPFFSILQGGQWRGWWTLPLGSAPCLISCLQALCSAGFWHPHLYPSALVSHPCLRLVLSIPVPSFQSLFFLPTLLSRDVYWHQGLTYLPSSLF